MTQGYQSGPNTASQIGGLGTAALGTLGLLNQAGALGGIKNFFTGSGNSTPSPYDFSNVTPQSQEFLDQYEPSDYGSSGGLPKDFKTKSYAKGGLVKSGLNDIRLYQLLG
jgi:hypothetical protein